MLPLISRFFYDCMHGYQTDMSKTTLLVLLYSLFCLSIPCLAQKNTFHKDSLNVPNTFPNVPGYKQITAELLKGVLSGDYKKPGWNEYVPRDNLSIDHVPLPAGRSRPRFITSSQLRQARHNRMLEPYHQWYQNMLRAVKTYNFSNEPRNVFKRTNHLKILAFLYKLENDFKYINQIERILANLPSPPNYITVQGGILGKDWGDYLESAQAISTLCVALDLVYDQLPVTLRRTVIEKMMVLIRQLIDGLPNIPANNHLIVIACAFMQTAILVDHPEHYLGINRNELWRIGIYNLQRSLGRVAPDGGYAEGVYYAGFILSYLSPFIVHFQNSTGINLLNHPSLENLILWYMANHNGSFTHALFDDALYVNPFFLPILVPFSRNGARIDFFLKERLRRRITNHNMVEALCVYQVRSRGSENLPDPVQIYPDMGQIIFKDQWVNPKVFYSILGERERWFADRHEHVEPLSLELSAFGQDIIIDAGYGRWVSDFNRTLWYKTPYAHNSILIDGLGTYHNPIWGDSIGSHFKHAFRTPLNASATLNTKIQDVHLTRKPYFYDNRVLLLIDKVHGAQHHDVAMNFNYSGTLSRISQDRIRIQKKDVTLDMIHISSRNESMRITRNFGLRTARMPPEQTGSIQLEHIQTRSGIFATIFYPFTTKEKEPVFQQKALTGDGKAYLLYGNDIQSCVLEFAVNRGRKIRTETWETDAQFIGLSYHSNQELQSILLVDFQSFHHAQIAANASEPVSLYLENHDGQWIGFFENGNDQTGCYLTLKGFSNQPIRFNHQVIHSSFQGDSSVTVQLNLQGSGSLELGMGSVFVKNIYKRHYSEQFITWLNQRYRNAKSYNSWSEHDKQIMQNQIVAASLSGMNVYAENLSHSLFNDPYVIKHAVNASGLLQETIADQTLTSLDLTHRHRLSGKFNDIHWDILEDGTYTEKGVRVRNIIFNTVTPDGTGMNYRFYHFFPGHRAHHLQLNANQRNALNIQLARVPGNDFQQIDLQLQKQRNYVHPGHSWSSSTGSNDSFINAGYKNYQLSLRRRETEQEKTFYESIHGLGKFWAFSLESQQRASGSQWYSEAAQFRIDDRLYLSQGLRATGKDVWKIERAYTTLNWYTPNSQMTNHLYYLQDSFTHGISYFRNGSDYYLTAYMDLENYEFRRENVIRLAYHSRFTEQTLFDTRIKYAYIGKVNDYKTRFNQSLGVQLEPHWQVRPLVDWIVPAHRPVQWIGGSLGYLGRKSIFSQFLYHPGTPYPQFDLQLSFLGKLLDQVPPAEIWIHLKHDSDVLHLAEIRILNHASYAQPGLYYGYDRFSGVRWEGYLHWRW